MDYHGLNHLNHWSCIIAKSVAIKHIPYLAANLQTILPWRTMKIQVLLLHFDSQLSFGGETTSSGTGVVVSLCSTRECKLMERCYLTAMWLSLEQE